MNDLITEIKASFEAAYDSDPDRGPITILSQNEELVPGFNPMRAFYEEALLVVTRRCYRHFAGSTMPTDSEELIVHTGAVVMPRYTALLFEAFADGVLIGHREDHLVKMCFHFENLPHLYHDDDFRNSSVAMAQGFAEDNEVMEFFKSYISGGVKHMAHATGFAHQQQVDPGKVWDVWLLIGTASICACYLAGHRMGSDWRERDVLDGIEIATEEDRHEPEGEAGPGS